MVPARLAHALPGGAVQCQLCPHGCRLGDGQAGVCGVRVNRGGTLFSVNSDRVAAVHVDPIEKKPLYHFLPGSASFSLAAMGCNLRCRFCQNHDLSMVARPGQVRGEPLTPGELVDAAVRSGCLSIAYTYTEPTVYFELMIETAQRARTAGLRNVMVSNGYISAAALHELTPLLDAANVDLKAFSDEFYRRQCNGRLQPVLETIATLRSRDVWVEVTTLLVPGLNTDPAELRRLADFLHGVDPNLPWHVSRFFPQHQLLDLPPTPAADMERALAIGTERGLAFVYSGNAGADPWSDTRCPGCGATLLRRCGYRVTPMWRTPGVCPCCAAVAAGVWR